MVALCYPAFTTGGWNRFAPVLIGSSEVRFRKRENRTQQGIDGYCAHPSGESAGKDEVSAEAGPDNYRQWVGEPENANQAE